jgi:hypothetical protein
LRIRRSSYRLGLTFGESTFDKYAFGEWTFGESAYLYLIAYMER